MVPTERTVELGMHDHELIVYGANPCGLAVALRAAREGLSVLLVEKHAHLGGMLSSGLCVWDTQYEGHRAPIYDELRAAIFDYYRTTYGPDSAQYHDALPKPKGHSNGNFEPRVAEMIIERIVAAEPGISVLRSHVPVSVARKDRLLDSVTFGERAADGVTIGGEVSFRAETYVDASYEGDLMAIAGADYRVGREGRDEYGEPHAGRAFGRIVRDPPNDESARLGGVHSSLALRDFPGYTTLLDADGSGTADLRVQAYNWRTAITDDPDNRLPVERPADYDPDVYKDMDKVGLHLEFMPNRKHRVNRPQLLELQHSYPDGSWEDRKRVEDAHWDALQGMLYFMRTDDSVDPETREKHRHFGLPRDEFADNGHRPYEMYARETRRLVGRYVYTQHDAMLASGTERAPSHPTSIAATEWYIDSHGCTNEKLPGSNHEGKIMLHQETFPGQLPYEALLPEEFDNLVVPCCASTTHVAWSTVRLEPTWINIGESVGWAAVLASGRRPGSNDRTEQSAIANVDRERLVQTLADAGIMIAFFNDIDVADRNPETAAAQLLAGHGFFADYDARLGEAIDRDTALLWVAGAKAMHDGEHDAHAMSERLLEVRGRKTEEPCVLGGEFARMIEDAGKPVPDLLRRAKCGSFLRRGEAARVIAELAGFVQV